MLLGCLAVFAPGQANAQDAYQEAREAGLIGPFIWNIGGQILVPVGPSGDRTDTGGGIAIGLTYSPSSSYKYGIQFEYAVDWSNVATGRLQNFGVFGNGLFQYFNLNALWRPIHAGGVSVYFIGGGGLYYRRVEIAQVVGTGFVPICDPWLLVCSTVPVGVEDILGSRNTWDWGVDGGMGLTFGVAGTSRLYVEARYHYIFGPTFRDVNNNERKADGQFVPVTIGVKF
jgi:hypothetical protein